MADPDASFGSSLFYRLKIDSYDLGRFTQVDGLGLETVVETVEEGGNNRFVHTLPKGLKYTNLKLTRPLDKEGSAMLQKWFVDIQNGEASARATAVLSAVQATNKDEDVLVSWNFARVIPIRWTGPQFSAESGKVATETLELAHEGFGPKAAQ